MIETGERTIEKSVLGPLRLSIIHVFIKKQLRRFPQAAGHIQDLDKRPTVCDKIPWKSSRLYRSEAFVAYSHLTMSFERVSEPICQKNIVEEQDIAKCSNSFVRGCSSLGF